MTARFLAEFVDGETLQTALQTVRSTGHSTLDVFTPYPIEGLAEQLGQHRSQIRPVMLVGGLATAAFALGLQWYSAVINYPIDSGGRPLNSWQVFLLVPFEVGIFAAALAGVIALLCSCGLPRLHDPLFEVPGFERATQDRYFLLAVPKTSAADLRKTLSEAGALTVTELRSP
jgi:hypothetical protein